MMSMKQFLAAQDENITDSEATKRYNEYRAEFRRQHINDFFNQHKDEEWYDSSLINSVSFIAREIFSLIVCYQYR